MSDRPTPMTDKRSDRWPKPGQPTTDPWAEIVDADFARTLERQLAELTERWEKSANAYLIEKGQHEATQRQLAEAKEAMQSAHKLLHEARRDYSDGMNLAAYERIQEAINHLTP